VRDEVHLGERRGKRVHEINGPKDGWNGGFLQTKAEYEEKKKAVRGKNTNLSSKLRLEARLTARWGPCGGEVWTRRRGRKRE